MSLSADSSGLTKGLEAGLKAVDKFAKETKKLANDVAQTSGVMLALGAAAMKLAASVDAGAARSMKGLEDSTKLLAVQVADVLRPAVDSLASSFRAAADWFAGLSDETKANISQWAIWVAGIAVAAKALATVSGLVSGLAGAMQSLVGVIGSIGFGPLIAGLTAVLALVVVVHRAWRKNWGDIQGITETVFNNIGQAVGWLGGLFGKLWDFIVDGAANAVEGLLKIVDLIQGVTGKKLVDTAGLREGFKGMFKDLKTGDFFKEGLKFAKSVASDAADAAIEELGIIRKEIASALGLGGNKGKARAPVAEGQVSVSEVGGYSNSETERRLQAQQFLADNAAIAAPMDAPQAQLMESATQFARGADYFVQQTLSAMGSAGAAVQNIMAGFAEGGPIGGLVSIGLELVTRMKTFQDLLGMLEKAFGRIGEFLDMALGSIFTAVGDLLAVLIESLRPLFEGLGPLFEAIAAPLRGIAPVLALLGLLFQGIAPILTSLGNVLGALMKALEPVLKILFEIVKVVMIVILAFMQAIIAIWNTIIDVIAGIVQGILTAITLGAGWKWAKDVADGIRSAKADTQGLTDAQNGLTSATYDSMNATAQQTAATWKTTDGVEAMGEAARDVTESLSNVPSGYKIALARFNADMGMSFSATNMYQNNRSGGGGGITVNGDVNITSSGDGEETLEEMRKAARKENAQRRGNPYADAEGL
ncbi:MAG: hypothetical protein AMXMBFR56_72550 [Polyangiaceae bacterium]